MTAYVIASAQDERILNEKRRHRDAHFDAQPVPTATLAGILVLGTRPRDFISSAYVQFLRVAGREWGDPIHELGQPGVVDYRNPILAEAMRALGLVQRFGFGIPTARRELREKGHPDPAFLVEPTRVQCTVWARR